MPIISTIGRKHWKVRVLHYAIYLSLIIGAATMIYPFLLMLSGSTKSAVDIRDYDPFPRFLADDEILYRKHVEGLFNESLRAMQIAYDVDYSSFQKAVPPTAGSVSLVREWRKFLERGNLPYYACSLGYVDADDSKTVPLMLRRFKHELAREYEGDIEKLNRTLGTEFVGWNAFYLTPEDFLSRRNNPVDTPFINAFRNFKHRQSEAYKNYFMVEGFFKALFLKTQYTKKIDAYNQAHGTHYPSYRSIRLTRRLPAGTGLERRDWETFVRHTLNLIWIRVDPEAVTDYRGFLRAKYGSIDVLNRNYQADYASFDAVPLFVEPPSAGLPLSDWDAFVTGWKDPDTDKLFAPKAKHLRIHSLEFMFRDYLGEQYGTISELNRALGASFQDFEEINPPQREAHFQAFLGGRKTLRKEFAFRNYLAVIDYMLLHGRGIVNTVIYCLLAVLAALIVNPIAAYAMSRYRLANTYKILLFMLLTMAFPPMVTQIPVFLMLRDFQLLNTFAALVLPGLANGYSIFLLKGFFDSLPRELYETAEIDGAGEWTMFWHVTMSLSKPILAVIALQAFTIAYSNFMFALLICQDERMWTLMVWLYQLQQKSGQGVMYASLIIAAVPTLLIFLFCQKIIMRGIVVPVEK